MDRGFAAICQLARTLPASHPVFVHRLASLLHASFRPHLTVRPLRFAITSPPSGCEEDLHLPAVDHARHTIKKAGRLLCPPDGIRRLTPGFCLGNLAARLCGCRSRLRIRLRDAEVAADRVLAN